MNLARHRLLFLALLAAIAAILVAGCSSDKKTTEPPKELEEQLGFSQEGIVERQTRVEGVIRDCMKGQGFDYTPVDPLAQRAALTGKSRMSDEEFLKQFGYGISTLFGRGGQQSDPNDAVRKSLSPADRAAYDRALYGETVGLTFAEAVDNDSIADLGGCTKQATESAFGGAALLTTLKGKLDELDERIAEDQRMVQATEKWSACMAEQGYRHEEPDEIDGEILKRFEAIIGPGVRVGSTTTPVAGASYDKAALQELQSDEVKIANADLACEKKHITPVDQAIRPQYEETFRAQNQKLLDRIQPVGS